MLTKEIVNKIYPRFIELFENKPIIVEAPGRINLIGEHTDYNDGFVLPAAINSSILFAVGKNDCNSFRFYSMDYNSYIETDEVDSDCGDSRWALYLLGVIAQFKKMGIKLSGIDCVFAGNIPIGAGLSSSAALECGFAYGINQLFSLEVSKYELVKMCQMAEHEYAGVKCGIMDQFASMFGKRDHVFRLDCRSNDYSYFPLQMKDHIIALVNTKVDHELASSEYNLRRKECEEGVSILKFDNPDVHSLRDVSLNELHNSQIKQDTVIYKRCHYVISENQRVLQACDALENSDFDTFGKLMYQSHEGLKKEYEVSCKELDMLVDITLEMDYVLGSRMMGGGFGGCTINIIEANKKVDFEKEITEMYSKKTGIIPELYFVELSDGVSIINQ